MDIYKYAAENKVRFNSHVGLLSVENLYGLDLSQLDELAVSLDTEKDVVNKTFLSKSTTKQDVLNKVKFEIVLDVIATIEAKEKAASDKKKRKDDNQKILDLIAIKDDEDLRSKSKEELLALLQDDE